MGLRATRTLSISVFRFSGTRVFIFGETMNKKSFFRFGHFPKTSAKRLFQKCRPTELFTELTAIIIANLLRPEEFSAHFTRKYGEEKSLRNLPRLSFIGRRYFLASIKSVIIITSRQPTIGGLRRPPMDRLPPFYVASSQLYRQPSPMFSPPARQNPAAAVIPGTRTKTVRSGTLSFLGLVGNRHGNILTIFLRDNQMLTRTRKAS